jgi:hypothetical protein
MLKPKLYAIACARALLLLFFSVLFPVFFAGYIVLMVCEWFTGFYWQFVAETKAQWLEFDNLLNEKK